MKPDGLIDLKRKWLPFFVLGSAIFGAGLALSLLWLYRQSPFTDAVVDFLTPSPTAPPRGTLISVLESTDSLLTKVRTGRGTLSLLASDSSLYHEATRTVAQLRTLLADIQANPRRYFRFSVF